MSEHSVRPRSPDHKVTVGWDPRLQTFYFKVTERNTGKSVAAKGIQEREIIDVIFLGKLAHRYAYFNNELREKLRADRDAGRRT